MGCLTRRDCGEDHEEVPKKGRLDFHLPNGECLPKEKRTTVLPRTTLSKKTSLPKTTLKKKR